jgi:hypothetical protein
MKRWKKSLADYIIAACQFAIILSPLVAFAYIAGYTDGQSVTIEQYDSIQLTDVKPC